MTHRIIICILDQRHLVHLPLLLYLVLSIGLANLQAALAVGHTHLMPQLLSWHQGRGGAWLHRMRRTKLSSIIRALGIDALVRLRVRIDRFQPRCTARHILLDVSIVLQLRMHHPVRRKVLLAFEDVRLQGARARNLLLVSAQGSRN